MINIHHSSQLPPLWRRELLFTSIPRDRDLCGVLPTFFLFFRALRRVALLGVPIQTGPDHLDCLVGTHSSVHSHARVPPAPFRSPFLFPDILALTGVSPASCLTHQLLGCTPQNRKPCSCQPQGQRKSPEIATKTSTVYWEGDLTCLKRKVMELHPTVAGGGGLTTAGTFTTPSRGRCTTCGANDVIMAHQLPGKPAAAGRGAGTVGSHWWCPVIKRTG